MDRLQLEEFQLALAVGSANPRPVPRLLAEQRPADWRGRRDQPFSDVGLFAGHQLVLDLFVLAGIEDGHGRAEPGLIGWDVDEVDHGKLAHPLLELPQPGVPEHLPLLGHVVFGVFTKVAQCDGLLNLCGKLGRQFVLQQLNLFCEPFHYLFWHGAFRNLLACAQWVVRQRDKLKTTLYDAEPVNPCTGPRSPRQQSATIRRADWLGRRETTAESILRRPDR